jgi:gluconate kinase
MNARENHFMPPALLHSQLAILQEPDADEKAIMLDITQNPQEILANLLQEFKSRCILV